jgi:cystatin-A/B
MATCGGFGNTRAATADEQGILESVKGAVEAHFGKSFNVFRAVSFQTQVVAGVNYIFKVQHDDGYAHVKVAKPLPHTNQPPFLMSVDPRADHTADSPIEIF